MSAQIDQYKARLRDALELIHQLNARLDDAERSANEPIAIVGMGCRFPGGEDGPEAYWRCLETGVDAVREIPPSRWPAEVIPGERQGARWAALLDDLATFDASFFGISPREAESLDPQQRMLLETTWEALEDAGHVPETLAGTRTGVFVGICGNDYQILVGESRSGQYDAYCTTGNMFSTAAGRISYTFGFQGPAVSLDTACSSSLVAIAQACQSLRTRDSDLGIAGGVNAILSPRTMALLLETQALSPDGRCKTLDARANGFVRGEGCGLLVLKRLADALRDGDRIRGVIRGWAVNQDGRSTGLTTPNVLSQQAMLRQALERAQVAPADIGYVEMHGTGTSLGDPIEADALREVLGAPRRDGSSCILGAAKTNIGHLEGAAGAAGIIKVLLALQHEKIPKNLHFRRLNPRISFAGTPFIVPTATVPWPRGNKIRHAGVSSFGLSGTNAHIIVEEAPTPTPIAAEQNSNEYLLTISAKTPAALQTLANSYLDLLSKTNDAALPDIVYTANMRRTHHEHRLGAVARTRETFIALLQSFVQGQATSEWVLGRAAPEDKGRKIVFVFSGQGSQWAAMGRALLDEEPVFRAKVEEIERLAKQHAPFSLLEALRAPEDVSRLQETEIAQPAIFAIQVAIAELLRHWGVLPSAVIGHSVGEIAAAHVAGALSLEDAVRLVILRGRIMQKATGHGKMVWVALSAADTAPLLGDYEKRVSIAAINDPSSVVLSGDTPSLDAIVGDLGKRGVVTRPLRVNYAFHSPQMEPLARELVAALGRVETKPTTITLYSTVTGAKIDGTTLDATYWGRNVRATVNFAAAVAAALDDDGRMLLEIAPHPVLLANIQQCTSARQIEAQAIPTLRRQGADRAAMLVTLAALHANGFDIDWKKLQPSAGRVVSLPNYPWQRQRYWIEDGPAHPTKVGTSVTDPLADILFEVKWERHDHAAKTKRPAAAGAWLLLMDRGGTGEALARELTLRNQRYVCVRAAEVYERVHESEFRINPESSADYRRLLDEAFDETNRCRGIVNLFALNCTEWQVTNARTMEADFRGIARIGTYLTHAVLKKVWRERPTIHWVTRGAQAAPTSLQVQAPAQAPLWTLARSLILEYPEIEIACVDLGGAEDDARQLLDEIERNEGEDQIALRTDGRYVAKLERKPHEAARVDDIALQADATYLIADGLSARGLSVARWMIDKGARQIILTAPRHAHEKEAAEISALNDSGANVLLVEADVGQAADVQRLFETLDARYPLRGVFVDVDAERKQRFDALEDETMRLAFRRMSMVWNLHTNTNTNTNTTTISRPLDFFILSSSASAILGFVGQSGYAASHAFIDAVAHLRRANGLVATSIQWGLYSDDSDASKVQSNALTLQQCVDVVERIIAEPCTQIAAMRLDARQMVQTFPQLAQSQFLAPLLTGERAEKKDRPLAGHFLRTLKEAPDSARFGLLLDHVRQQSGAVLRQDPATIPTVTPFQTLGVDSLMSLEVRNRLEAGLGLEMPATLLFTYTNIEQLAKYAFELLLPSAALAEATVHSATTAVGHDEPIAVVGMACRFPTDSNDPEIFWQALRDGVDSVREVSPTRWPTGTIPEDKLGAGYAALLNDIDKFDAAFFGISPREAESLDPQHRLLLEVTWDALENGGLRPDQLSGTKTGVFVGCATLDYQRAVLSMPNHLDAYGITGTMLATAAGRLSYVFGFQGPAVALDTACSSSLVAIHLGCQSLRNGESDLVVAGGVNALLTWDVMVAMATMRALSPDGRCKTLDSRANGYVRGEGCGMVVLKRLSDAQRDGDRILAIVRGSAINQDGRSTGLTTPNVLAQQDVLRQALRAARLTPEQIGYVEMHGTGTPLGDPIEADALRQVLGAPHPDGSSCVLGALKTNIGHLEGAAGVAGFIKIVQVFRHGIIPKNLHFRALNPRISFDGTPLVIPTENMPWPRRNEPRRAGVSAFGLSGTNAHVILEEAAIESPTPGKEASAYLLTLSAKNPEALTALARSYGEWFSLPNEAPLYDVVYTANVRRVHHEHRLAIVARTREEFANAFAAYTRGEIPAGVAQGRISPRGAPRVVFVFPGQGSQWLGMGRQLFAEEAVFRTVIEACDAPMKTESGFSLVEEMNADEGSSRLMEIDVVQPVLFAIEIALAALWKSWGVEPDCVVGHSMGEVAAAHIAGILTLDDAIRIICRRSKLLKRIRGQGVMALVELPMAEARAALAGHETTLSVAVSNGPRSTVLSGDPIAMERVLAQLEAQGVFCRRVKVDVASHSPQVDPLLADLLDTLHNVKPVSGSVHMRSTVTGQPLPGPELVASYWADNLRQPVQFSKVVRDLLHEGHDFFLEMSPHPILLPSIEENLKDLGVEGIACSSMRRQTNERQTMLEALGLLQVRGGKFDCNALYPERGRIVSLPNYPWQRERFWIEPPKSGARRKLHEGEHPLLGQHFVPASQPELHVWEQWLSVEDFPYLADHAVQGEVVFPGAGYVEMAIAAAKHVYGEGNARLEEITFDQMLALPQNSGKRIQVSLREEGGGRAAITISSQPEGSPDWVRHSTGTVRVVATSTQSPETLEKMAVQARCPEVITGSTHYEHMTAHRLFYGPAFQGVAEIHVGTDELVAEIQLKPEALDTTNEYGVHPALLDACFQATAWVMSSTKDNSTFVPVKVSGFRLYERPERNIWIHARRRPDGTNHTPTVSFVARNDHGQVLFEVAELQARALDSVSATSDDPFSSCIFNIDWHNVELAPAPINAPRKPNSWLVLLDRHLGRPLVERLRANGDRVVQVAIGNEYARLGDDSYVVNPNQSEHWERVVTAAFGKAGFHGAIHCGALDGASWQETTLSTVNADIRRGPISVLRLVQTLLKQGWRDTPRLYLLTRGAQAVGPSTHPVAVTQSMMWGMGRVLATEQPDLACVRIDLPPEPNSDEPAFLLRELNTSGDEDQIALRSGNRYVARLVRGSWAHGENVPEHQEPAAGRPYRLGTREPGLLENLVLRVMERRPPGPGEVEIEIESAGLNFLDVMKAMGIYPGMDRSAIQLGGECAGTICAVGEGVTNFHVGHAVIASAPASFSSHITVRADFVVLKPNRLSFEEAAAIPSVFMTAYWALHHIGRLRRGERVLIHSASGGLGLAAIQYAQALGAEIFATAGSDKKRSYLRSLGIEHVMDSRSTDFAEEILSKTNRRGVDVVLNSLTGDALLRSLDVLAPYGRFLEVGKKDIYENSRLGLLPFRKSLSYTAIDLAGMAEERPDEFRSLLEEVVSKFADGTFQPEPTTVFPVNEASEAFRLMAQSKHIGKIVVRMRDAEARVSTPNRAKGAKLQWHADATYLITGGLGGLGLSLAKWMVAQGAGNLALVGRRDPSPTATRAIDEMRSAGANIKTLRADVARSSDVQAMMAQIESTMPPLRGIVHAAGLLADRTIPEMDENQFLQAVEPKVFGAWNLHEATRNKSLDFFVMYSSAAGLLGSPGQANYAAANTFLDALGHARVAQGLAGTSIQWGTFSEVGLAAASDIRGNRASTRGGAAFKPEEGNLLFGRVLEQPRPEIGLMHFEVRQWMEFYPHVAGAPFFSELVRESGVSGVSKGANFSNELQQAAPTQRLGMIVAHLVEQLGKVLRLDPGKIDHHTPFASLGMDSLMSLELRNRLEASMGLKLSAALLFTYSTTIALGNHLLERLFPARAPVDDRGDQAAVDNHEIEESRTEVLPLEPEDESALVDKLGEFEEYLK